MNIYAGFAASTCLLLSSQLVAGQMALSEYNLVTVGDFMSNSEVEGKTFVGGNLIGASSQNFGIHLTPPYDGASLQVAGTVVGGNPLNVAGAVEVSNANTVWQNANQYKINGRFVNNATSVTTNSNLAGLKAQLQADLEQTSESFSQLSANSTVSIPWGCCGPYQFQTDVSLSSGDVAVFDINSWGIFTNTSVQQVEMLSGNFNDLDAVIINVGGLQVNWSNSSNMVGQHFTSIAGREKILWNFYEATSINLFAHSFMGALLAPYATVTAANPIEGSVGVFSLLTTSEVHLPLTQVEAVEVVSVPEPRLIWIFVVLCAVAALRARLRTNDGGSNEW